MRLLEMPILPARCPLLLGQQRQLRRLLALLRLQEAKGGFRDAGAALPLLLGAEALHVTPQPGLRHLDATGSRDELFTEGQSQPSKPSSSPQLEAEDTEEEKNRNFFTWTTSSS